MKKIFTITFTTLAVVSVGAVLLIRTVGASAELSNEFRIETLYGDEGIIDEILEISAIRNTGRNFQRVVLTSGEAEITDIVFDARHHLDERQLANREFYRGTHRWQRNNPNTTDNFHVMMTENWPHGWTINVLDLRTGDVVRVEDTTNRHAFGSQSWWGSPVRFIEHNGQLYVAVVAENEPRARFYSIDFTTASIVYRFSINENTENYGSWFQSANNLYFYEMGAWVEHREGNSWWGELIEVESLATGGFDRETGIDTLTASDRRLSVLNLDTRTFEERPSPVGITSWTWGASEWSDYMIVSDILNCNNPADQWNEANWCGHMDGISLINLEEGYRHVFPNTLFEEMNENHWGGSHGTHFYVISDYLIESSIINDTLQVIRVFDLNAMELIYRGHIQLIRNGGLLFDNWNGNPYPFEIRARD